MTDGPTLPLTTMERLIVSESPASSMAREVVEGPDLTTFVQWLELQPTFTCLALLYALAFELANNRDYQGPAYEIRRATDDLKALSRHER